MSSNRQYIQPAKFTPPQSTTSSVAASNEEIYQTISNSNPKDEQAQQEMQASCSVVTPSSPDNIIYKKIYNNPQSSKHICQSKPPDQILDTEKLYKNVEKGETKKKKGFRNKIKDGVKNFFSRGKKDPRVEQYMKMSLWSKEVANNYELAQDENIRQITVTETDGMKIIHFPIEEVYTNTAGRKVRLCHVGFSSACTRKERCLTAENDKTILMLGETGCGKSTWIDGFVNFLMGVKFEDDFRFQLIDKSADVVDGKVKTDIDSQTEWLTSYTIPKVGDKPKAPFNIHLIDTPGFADTSGIFRDHELIKQIQEFFTNSQHYHVQALDAVCLVIKASVTRLTAEQDYVLNAILHLFGKDMAKNIFIMITFADSSTPKVLKVIKDVPYKKYFCFNNGALHHTQPTVTSMDSDSDEDVSKNDAIIWKKYWTDNNKRFEKFLNILKSTTPCSLTLTKDVLEKRNALKTLYRYLEISIEKKLTIMQKLTRMKEDCEENRQNSQKRDGQEDALSSYRSTTLIPNERNEMSTNCRKCQKSCHLDCYEVVYGENTMCYLLQSANTCIVCRCASVEHIHEPLTYKEVESIPITLSEMKANSLKELQKQCTELGAEIKEEIEKARKTYNSLLHIALKPGFVNQAKYIDFLIDNERNEATAGWEERIKSLSKLKQQDQDAEAVAEAIAKEADVDDIEKILSTRCRVTPT